ncbi:MAG: beta-galactosidase [Armatimonadota bacterium]
MTPRAIPHIAIVATACAYMLGAPPSVAQETAAQWIWYPEAAMWDAVDQDRFFRKQFELPAAPQRAELWLMVDDRHTLWVNGTGPLEAAERDGSALLYPLTGLLVPGSNLIAVQAYNATSVAGVLARLSVLLPGGQELVVNSDRTWRASREGPYGWNRPGFDDSAWEHAQPVGHAFALPWVEYATFANTHFVTDEEQEAWARARAALMAPPEQFADDPPIKVQAAWRNGSAVAVINGEARPLVFYRGIIDLFTEHGRRQVANFRDAGVHLYCGYVRIDKLWTGPGQYDFSALDEQVRMYTKIDPDAYVLMLVRLVQPSWWQAAHPDELVGYGVPGEPGGDEQFRAVRASMASEAWLRDTGEAWRAMIEHLEGQPWGRRVLGYMPAYGISAEWHYFGSWREQYPDTGAAMTARFRRWLREQYGTVAALRAAWRDPKVTFESAQVPGVEPRRFGAHIAFHDPATERAAIDYYRCHQRVVAEAIEHFGRIVKDETAGAKLCGVYYGYFFEVGPQTQGGHLELDWLFASPNVDFFVAPYSYSRRLMGDDGRLRNLAAAARLGGKPHILEGDIRTFLHPRDEYGRTENLEQTLAAITREFSTALIEGAGFFWVDFGGNEQGGWFDHPQIMERAAALQRVAMRALEQPHEPAAQIALIADLESFYALTDGHGMKIAYRLLEDVGTEMYHLGAPFDGIHLSQLADANLSRYRMLVFLNPFMLDAEEAATIRRLREAGEHAMVFLWAPGLIAEDALSVERAEQVTGLELDYLERWLPAQIEATAGSPLLARLEPTRVLSLTVSASTPVDGFGDPANWIQPRDEQTMQEWYKTHEIEAVAGGVAWTFDTSYHYTDIHFRPPAPVDPRQGIRLDVKLTGDAPTLPFTFVIKDANWDEFVAPDEVLVEGESYRFDWPLEAFTNAPWARNRPERPALPLQGAKFVLREVANVGCCTLEMTNLSAETGEVIAREELRFGSGAFGPALIPRQGGRLLGRIAGTDLPGLVATGSGRALSVFCSVPYVPRELLAGVMREAGVHQYIDEGPDVLRADARLIALHTAAGGPRTLRLPAAATVSDALSGATLGAGTEIALELEPESTVLMELGR